MFVNREHKLGLIMINLAGLPLALRSTSTASFYAAKLPSEALLRSSEDYTTILVPSLLIPTSHFYLFYIFLGFCLKKIQFVGR